MIIHGSYIWPVLYESCRVTTVQSGNVKGKNNDNNNNDTFYLKAPRWALDEHRTMHISGVQFRSK